ncbi:hypothetical protein GCM10010289_79240 [Streptomyces violascens]|uniref:Uncharacterized protein n=1 Tax=Streptomyces violascens TaxID=67381 RepID=A0ABQ3QEZ7_9ACTN|nr:hypothetical protein GCM10010289_79240 [Streptomyces violascens]GHI35841.1 hypothetical protein Sviol_02490 [Streptomyces violascens]
MLKHRHPGASGPERACIVAHARFGHDDTVNQGDHGVHAGGSRPSSLLIPFC